MAAPAPTPTREPDAAVHPTLEHAWHPVALSRELGPGGWMRLRLLGRTWSLHRGDRGLAAAPPAFDVGERHGVIWLAPCEPRSGPLSAPEADDRRFVVAHLAPVRAPGPAGPLLARLLAHGGPDEGRLRTSTAVGAPFGFTRRVHDPSTGAASALVVALQPEDADSTRVYGTVLLSAGPGNPLPSPAAVAVAAAAEQRALAAAAG